MTLGHTRGGGGRYTWIYTYTRKRTLPDRRAEDDLTRCTHKYGQELLESENPSRVHLPVEK